MGREGERILSHCSQVALGVSQTQSEFPSRSRPPRELSGDECGFWGILSIGFSVLWVGRGQTVGFELLTLLKILQGLQEVFQLPSSLCPSLTQHKKLSKIWIWLLLF